MSRGASPILRRDAPERRTGDGSLRRVTGWGAGDRTRPLQLALAALWLIDAALQYQPYMFGSEFVTQTLEPAANGVPGWAGRAMISVDQFLLPHVAWWNALFATVQLLIAAGIVWSRTTRAALAASVVWALAVWWVGEGFGGMFVSGSPLMGWPGAVILYAIISVVAWPRRQRPETGTYSRAERSPLGPVGSRLVWLLLWIGAAVYLLRPVNRSSGSIESMIASMSEGEPHWVMTVNRALSAVAQAHGTELSIGLAVLCCMVGACVLVPVDPRPVLVLAVALALVIWLAEDFGAVFTGSGTDPNSGPLLALLVAAYWRGAPRRLPPRSAVIVELVEPSEHRVDHRSPAEAHR